MEDSGATAPRPLAERRIASLPAVADLGSSLVQTLAAAAVIIAGLYFFRDVLIPFVLAALLTFLLAPAVLRLRRWGLPRIPAVLTVAAVSFLAIAAVGWTVSLQLLDLAGQLPQYEQNIRGKLQGFEGPGSGVVARMSEMVEHLRDDLAPAQEDGAGSARAPIPVEIREPEPTSIDLLRDTLGSLLGPLATAGVVVVLVIFMLIQREDLRDRFFGLIGTGHLNITTKALDDAARRISQYLLMQLAINVSYGIPVAIGLYFIGVPNAMLWGALATLLRFVPYVGPLLGMAAPLALAFAVEPGWIMLLLTLALFVVLELFSNNVMEPWLYGASTGISPVAIMMAAIFWTSVWGPIGLLLSTPLTVCLVVMGRYLPQLQFLSTMLGTESALPPEARFYQRLLAADVEEAAEIADNFLEDGDLVEAYEKLLMPALILLEEDRHRGALDDKRQHVILAQARELVDELAERVSDETGVPFPPQEKSHVVLLPARDEADELAARMLAHVLARQGIRSFVIEPGVLLGDRLDTIREKAPRLVCVCAIPPAALTHAAYTCRRLRRRLPDMRTVVALFSARADAEKLRTRLPADLVDEIVTSLGDAVAHLAATASGLPEREWKPAPIPDNEQERLAELATFDLLDSPPEEAFDRVTRELARVFGAPISLMSLIDGERQFWKSQYGLPPELAAAGASDRESSMCGHVVADNDVLVVNDTQVDPRFAENPFLQSCGIRFYAGAPLRTRTGSPIGSLCVIDTRPRQISAREREMLRMVADAVMTQIELRAASRGLRQASQQLAEENRALHAELQDVTQGRPAASTPAP